MARRSCTAIQTITEHFGVAAENQTPRNQDTLGDNSLVMFQANTFKEKLQSRPACLLPKKNYPTTHRPQTGQITLEPKKYLLATEQTDAIASVYPNLRGYCFISKKGIQPPKMTRRYIRLMKAKRENTLGNETCTSNRQYRN